MGKPSRTTHLKDTAVVLGAAVDLYKAMELSDDGRRSVIKVYEDRKLLFTIKLDGRYATREAAIDSIEFPAAYDRESKLALSELIGQPDIVRHERDG